MTALAKTEYWLWEEWTKSGKWVGLDVEATMSKWNDGVRFETKPDLLEFKTTNGKPFPDVLPINRRVPVLSPRMIEILERHGAEADYYEVSVRRHARNEASRFYRAANITRTVACLDRAKSKIQKFPGSKDIQYLTRFHLVARKIPKRRDGKPLAWFRLAEYTYLILVHDSLKRDIESAGIAGVRFIEPEKYIDEMYTDDLPRSKVPQPTWGPTRPEPVIESVELVGYKGSGAGALRASMEGKPFKPKKGRAVTIEFPRDAEEIHLAFRQLSGVDLSVCTKMPNLRRVSIAANLVIHIDLAPLAKCAKVELIDLSRNYLSTVDLAPLAKLASLREVRLNGNANLRVIDASPLAANRKMKSLLVDLSVDVTGLPAKKIVRV